MVITDHRVQSVLRTYTRQLQRSNTGANKSRQGGGADSGTEKVSISGKGKRMLMMDRLASQVLEKMYSKNDADSSTPGNENPVGNEAAAEGNK